MKLKIVAVCLFMVTMSFVKTMAQQDPMYTQYMFNMLPLNPAYAGSRDVVSMTALYRNQWVNLPGAPQTTTFSIDAPIKKEKIGIGINVFNDRIGIFNNTSINAMGSYRIRLKKSTLAFGIQAGATQMSANYGGVRTSNLGNGGDPVFEQNFNAWLPNIGAGVYYSSDRFYVGLSLPHLLDNKISNYVKNQQVVDGYFGASQFRHVFLIGGYVFQLNRDLVLKPSLIYKFVEGAPMQLDLNCNLWIYDKFGIGASYRSIDAVSLLFEVQATQQIRFGYAFDYSHTRLRTFSYGSHEIMVRYEFGYNKSKVISPRYF